MSDKETVEPEVAPEAELPSLPKRPQSAFEKLKGELTQAFPDLDEKLIITVLILSKGHLDQCFNALLYYNDPANLNDEEIQLLATDLQPEPDTQLIEDENMAKKLAKKYSRRERYNNYLLEENREDNSDSFEKFMENDLPQLRQQLNKNLEETSTKISNWFGNLNKKFNDNGNQPLFSAIGNGQQQGQNPPRQPPRPSQQLSRYDYDSEPIADQTAGISLNDNTNEDIYGTPKLKKSFEEDKSKKISVVKPEPIEADMKKETASEKVDKPNDDDFLVDDSEEE